MAIALENSVVSVDLTTGLTSKTIAYTCTGSNLALVVAVGGFCDTSTDQVSAMTYNGVTMNRGIAFTPGSEQVYIYTLLNPASGTNNVVVTFTPSWQYELLYGIGSFTGVGSIGTNTGGRQGSGVASPWTDSISIAAGSVAVDSMCSSFGTAALTPSGSQTRIGSEQDVGTSLRFTMSYLINATAMAWTWTGGNNQRASHGIIELVVAAGGGSASITPAAGGSTVSGVAGRNDRGIITPTTVKI